ncbi:MAG: GntR family transcriptional regulator [Chloroflexi bacterium]|nr:GntR family transcriptional regulator [Chloroflexota bacterium]
MFELEPIKQSDNLSDEVARRLRQAIKSGNLSPGTHLVEQEIAEQFLVSRMPVRIGIQKLIDEGLVFKEPRRGAFVHTFSSKELDEVYSIRVALEKLVVQFAVPNWSSEVKAELEGIVVQMRQAASEDDRQTGYELDTRFHSILWELSQHSILIEVVSSLRSRISRFLVEANNVLSPTELNHHVKAHQTLVNVLNKGDIERAKDAIADHILDAHERIKKYYSYLD